MKENLSIYILFLVIGCITNSLAHAQKQKPSEKSYATQLKAIKEIRAAYDAKTRQMQQPSDNKPATNEHATQSPGTATKQEATMDTHTQQAIHTRPAQNKVKPSEGSMKQQL